MKPTWWLPLFALAAALLLTIVPALAQWPESRDRHRGAPGRTRMAKTTHAAAPDRAADAAGGVGVGACFDAAARHVAVIPIHGGGQ